MRAAAAGIHRAVMAVLVALALTAGVVAVALVAARVNDKPESVYLEARAAIGASPFVRPAANTEPATRQPDEEAAPSADTAGTGDIAMCDPARLIDYLTSHPDAAAAWVDALNSDPTLRWSGGNQVSVEQIPAYIGELTPAVLGEDSRVTNFQFVDGRASGVQSVLQNGTAVLMDGDGVPRVRCACGNPLTPMKQISAPADYEGEPWSGFTPIQITIIVKDDDPDCDSDEYWDGDRCRPYRYCPDDMYLGQDGRCYFPQDPCPSTWERDGNGWCYDPDPEYCDDGSVKRPDKDCHRPIECPIGYERHGHKCVEPPKCPPDQDRVGDECRPKPQCPDGTQKVADKDCVDPPKPCPDGTPKRPGKDCVDPPKPECPDGSAKVAGKECPVSTEKCPDGSAKVTGKECAPPTDKCADGSARVAGQDCPAPPEKCADGSAKVAGQDCPAPPVKCADGSARVAGQECPAPAEKCADGSARVAGQECPAPAEKCADGSARVAGQECPASTEKCADGSVKPAGKACAAPVEKCADGSVKPAGKACPAPPVKCPDGSVKVAGKACPAPAEEPDAEAVAPAAPPVEQQPKVAPKQVVPAAPQAVVPKAPAATKAPLTCPNGTTAAATVGCPIPATGVPAGWVQRGKTMFPAAR